MCEASCSALCMICLWHAPCKHCGLDCRLAWSSALLAICSSSGGNWADLVWSRMSLVPCSLINTVPLTSTLKCDFAAIPAQAFEVAMQEAAIGLQDLIPGAQDAFCAGWNFGSCRHSAQLTGPLSASDYCWGERARTRAPGWLPPCPGRPTTLAGPPSLMPTLLRPLLCRRY